MTRATWYIVAESASYRSTGEDGAVGNARRSKAEKIAAHPLGHERVLLGSSLIWTLCSLTMGRDSEWQGS